MGNKLMKPGAIAFMVGFFGAIILALLSNFGIWEMGGVVTTILIIAGLVIGLMNISAKEKVPIMISALVLGGGAGVLASLPLIGGLIEAILTNIALVLVPVGIVVAFETFRKNGA